jgi:hypothetical protein
VLFARFILHFSQLFVAYLQAYTYLSITQKQSFIFQYLSKPVMYSTSKRITAFILLLSQLLTTTSCNGNFSIPTEPKIAHEHKKLDKKLSQTDALVPLVNKEVAVDESLAGQLPLESNREASVVPIPITANKNQSLVSSHAKTAPRIVRSTGHSIKPARNRAEGIDFGRNQVKGKQRQALELVSVALNMTKRASEQTVIEHSLIAKGGHRIQLKKQDNSWRAIVQEHAPQGFSRTLYVDVYLAPGFTIKALSKHSLAWQEAHTAVIFPEKSPNGKGYVYIGEGGLLGGGKQKGCDFGPKDRRRDPDNPGRWVCPGTGKHPRNAPKSESGFGPYGHDSDDLEQRKTNDAVIERARQYEIVINRHNQPIYDTINTISKELLNKYKIDNIDNIHQQIRDSKEAENLLSELYTARSEIISIAADLKDYMGITYRELEEVEDDPYCYVPALKQLEDLNRSVNELNDVYHRIEGLVGDDLAKLGKLVDLVENGHLKHIAVHGIIAKGENIKLVIKQAIEDAALYKMKSTGFFIQGSNITELQKKASVNRLMQAKVELDKVLDRALKIQKSNQVNYPLSSQEMDQSLRIVDKQMALNWNKPTCLGMKADSIHGPSRKEAACITESDIRAIDQELKGPLNRIEQIIREETKSALIIEACYDIQRKIHELIQRVNTFKLDGKALVTLRNLQKLDREFEQKIREEKHKIFVESINREIKQEYDKVKQIIASNSDIRVILEAASKFKLKVELMRGRLKDRKSKLTEILELMRGRPKDCKSKRIGILATFRRSIRKMEQMISEQKEKAIQGATSQEEKQLISEHIKKAEIEIKSAELKAELEKYQEALEKYQQIKIDRQERIIEAKERIKEYKGYLEFSHRKGRAIEVIAYHKRQITEAKHLLKHAEGRLHTIEETIREYTNKLEEAGKKLKEAEEEKQEILHRHKAAEEAYRAKAEEVKKQQQEEEMRKKAAARVKELERKYRPSPALQAAMSDTKVYLEALELDLLSSLSPTAVKSRGQALLKQMAALKAEEEASHKRIQGVYQSDNSSEGDQLIEEELAVKEIQLEKIKELRGQLLAVLDLTIEELKDCGIERDTSKGLVREMASLPLIDTEKLPTKEQLEDKLAEYLRECQDEIAFKQLLDTYEIAITKLEASPSNPTLKANKEAIEAELQANQLYKEGFELLMLSTHLRQAAEEEADRCIINSVEQAAGGVPVSDLAIASQKRAEAKQIRNNIILELRDLFKCANSPEMGKKAVAAVKGAGKSIEDTAKGALVLASLPVLLIKLGYKSAESIVKWEDKLGVKGKYGSAKETIKAIFKEAKYDWENVEEYRTRQQGIRNYKKQMLAYNKAFNAQAYHCGQAEEFGYITMEVIQFFFGDALIKAADGVLKANKAAKGVRVAEEVARGGYLVRIGAVEGDVMTFSSKIGKETVEGITNFVVKDGKLYLNQLHLQGSSAGNVGRKALWDMAKDLGRQYNVKEVIIQGGKRTTGKYKGQVPSPITIKID